MNGIEFPLNHQVCECAVCYWILRIFVKFTLHSINIVYYIAANIEQRWIVFNGVTFNENENERHLMGLSGNEDELIVVQPSQFSNILWEEKVQTKKRKEIPIENTWNYDIQHPGQLKNLLLYVICDFT